MTFSCRESNDQGQDDTGKGKGKARATITPREGLSYNVHFPVKVIDTEYPVFFRATQDGTCG